MTSNQMQRGIGLVEVMIALAILLLAAIAVGTLQTTAIVGAQGSSVHFSLDHLSNEMLDILRTHSADAQSGAFNFDAAVDSDVSAHTEAVSWNQRIGQVIPTGLGAVNCDAGICNVSISWIEEIDGTHHRQFFRARTPL